MFWAGLYLSIFSGAILATELVVVAELHPILTSCLVLGLVGFWYWWQDAYGQIYPSTQEILLKAGLLLTGVSGCAVLLFYRLS